MKRIAIVLFLISQTAFATEFKVKARGEQVFHLSNLVGKNQIVFYSKAALKELMGETSVIAGWVKFDPAHVESATGEAVVPATTFTTGIDLQDQLMQGEQWLDAKNYPTITFVLKSVHVDGRDANNKLRGTITGELTLHGVTRTIVGEGTTMYLEQSPETLKRAPGDFMCVNGTFDVSLKDFTIAGRPDLIGSKIADRIRISVSLFGSNSL